MSSLPKAVEHRGTHQPSQDSLKKAPFWVQEDEERTGRRREGKCFKKIRMEGFVVHRKHGFSLELFFLNSFLYFLCRKTEKEQHRRAPDCPTCHWISWWPRSSVFGCQHQRVVGIRVYATRIRLLPETGEIQQKWYIQRR